MRPHLLAAPAVVLLTLTVAGPLVLLLRLSIDGWEPSLFDSRGIGILRFTLLFGVAVAGVCLAIAYPLALWLRTLPPPSRRLALALILLPKFASALAVLSGLSRLLASRGPVASLVAESSLILPYAIIFLYLHVSAIDPALEAAARGLGATPWQVFLRVTLPLSVPGLLVAGQLALVWGLGAYAGPLLFGGPAEMTLSVEVNHQAFVNGRYARAAATAVLLAAAVALALAAFPRSANP